MHRRLSTDFLAHVGDEIIRLESRTGEMTHSLLVFSFYILRKEHTALV